MIVWWPTLGFAGLGVICLWVAGAVILGGIQRWIAGLAGAAALGFLLISGDYARHTWVGLDLLPWIAGLSPYLSIVAAVLVGGAALGGALAAGPHKWSPVAVVPPLLISVWLLPSVAPLMPGGQVTDVLDKTTTSVTKVLVQKTERWFVA
jgi:hypothetical protein